MFDPCTVAHEIRLPWWTYRPWPKHRQTWDDLTEQEKVGRDRVWREGYRSSFLTIWHNDPCKDGSDDSCGFSRPKLTARQRELMKWAGWAEGQEPWFQRLRAKKQTDPLEAECLIRAAVVLVAQRLEVRLTVEEATFLAVRLTHNNLDNLRSMIAFLPGYHTNSQTDSQDARAECAERFFCYIAGAVMREKRRWWQHPRWHFWHHTPNFR